MRRGIIIAGALALASVSGLGGCTFGAGSAYVGQWKPRHRVEFEACLREPGPPGVRQEAECKERKEVISDEPGRRFWGVITSPLQFGAARVRFRGEDNVRFRFVPNIEILRGKGRWAYGVRTGVMFEPVNRMSPDPNDPPETEVPVLDTFAWDVTAVGHVSIMERMSLYAGAGYLPYSSYLELEGHVGGRGLLGTQIALSKTHSENFLVLTLELDHYVFQLDDDTYRSTGLSGTIGIFF